MSVADGMEQKPSTVTEKAVARVLIVDDEKAIRDLFKILLSLDLPQCRVDLAVNGAEAVAATRDSDYDVIVMDLHMPVMDGEAAFRAIGKNCDETGRKMPSVVFCTGYDPSLDLTKMITKNPEHCVLRKPVTNENLTRAIKARLRS